MPSKIAAVCKFCDQQFIGYKNKKYCSLKCYHKAKVGRIVTHGATGHPLYHTWRAMVARCHNKNHGFYPRWGGRGIKVFKPWRKDVWSFIQWAEQNGYAKGLEIDRKDNNKGYSPQNCRFVTDKEQANNRRPPKFTIAGRAAMRAAVIKTNKRRWRTRAGRIQMNKNLEKGRRAHAYITR